MPQEVIKKNHMDVAWHEYTDENGETPESSGKKGDHLIGDYYVAFDKHYKAEVKELMARSETRTPAQRQRPCSAACWTPEKAAGWAG